MPAVFYILYSHTADRYYIGHTTEPIEVRIRKHNSNHRGFTGKYRHWILLYLESYTSKGSACQRELQVKNWKSKKRIEQLIARSEQLFKSVG